MPGKIIKTITYVLNYWVAHLKEFLCFDELFNKDHTKNELLSDIWLFCFSPVALQCLSKRAQRPPVLESPGIFFYVPTRRRVPEI